jgi:hypothetical protein
MSDNVQLIKEEIERRMNNLWYLIPEGEKVLKDDFTKDDANNLGKYTALENLLHFIDSLPEEPESKNPVGKEEEKLKLRQAAISYLEKQQGKELNSVSEEQCLRIYAFEGGSEWQKQEIMKNAVDATILDIDAQTIEFGLWPEKLLDIKEGDKVKIIILK